MSIAAATLPGMEEAKYQTTRSNTILEKRMIARRKSCPFPSNLTIESVIVNFKTNQETSGSKVNLHL